MINETVCSLLSMKHMKRTIGRLYLLGRASIFSLGLLKPHEHKISSVLWSTFMPF